MTLEDWIRKITSNEEALSTIGKSEDRIVRAYKELLSGYDLNTSQILNEVVKVENYEGLVLEKDIQFTSICGHHFLPFFGSMNIAYEPNKIITGLGKLPRLVQAYSKRFQIQELLVKDIADEIMKSIDAKGVYVTSKARHLCMHSRGPSDRNVETICTYSLGTLKNYREL
jgi:GTP cyclohydrolase I